MKGAPRNGIRKIGASTMEVPMYPPTLDQCPIC